MENQNVFFRVYDACIEKDIDDAEEELKKIFKSVRYCDEKIDDWIDGNDGEEGEYLINRSYQADEYDVRIYFGQESMNVTDIDVRRT